MPDDHGSGGNRRFDQNDRQIAEAGYNMARIRYYLMRKLIWSYDDWLVATNFLMRYMSRDPANIQKEIWIDPRFEINMMPRKGKDTSITAGMLPDEITRMLAHPYVTAYYKSLFDQAYGNILNLLDPLSRGYVFSWSPSTLDYKRYEELSDWYWVKWMAPGNTGVVTGFLGSGKTDHVLDLALKHNAYYSQQEEYNGATFLSNIEMQEGTRSYDLYHNNYFSTFGEMMVKLFDNHVHHIKTLIIPDELTMNNIRKKKTMKGGTLTLGQFDKGIRKLDATIIYIWHQFKEVPEEISEFLRFISEKQGGNDRELKRLRKNTWVTFRGGSRETYEQVKGLKKTEVEFKSGAFAAFVQDIDWDKDIMVEFVKRKKEGMPDDQLYAELRDTLAAKVKEMQGVEVEDAPEQPLEVKVGYTKNEMLINYRMSKGTFSILLGDHIHKVGEYKGSNTKPVPTYKMDEDYEQRYWSNLANMGIFLARSEADAEAEQEDEDDTN